jgi:hypothetical protein
MLYRMSNKYFHVSSKVFNVLLKDPSTLGSKQKNKTKNKNKNKTKKTLWPLVRKQTIPT